MNFRELVAALDSRGDMLCVRKEVHPEYELPALLAQAEKRGKACRFERVTGSPFPAVGAVLTSPQRWAIGLGLSSGRLDEPNVLEQTIADAVAAPLAANVLKTGPVSEVAVDGDDIDIASLPVPRFFAGDSHRFITAGIGFAQNPETGVQNAGFYRMPLIGPRSVSVSTGPTSDLSRIYNLHRERATKMQIAVAVGVPPALQIAAAADLPADLSDIDVAGALQRSPVNLVKCRTSDILVPADAEFVIEMTIDFDTLIENTMGEFGDQYGTTTSPAATIDAITHRGDAMYHVIMAGMGREHNELGRLMCYRLRGEILEALQNRYPVIRDVLTDMTPPRMGMRGQINVSVDKTDDQQPRQIIEDIFTMKLGRFPLSMLIQRVVVVDTDVDIHNPQDIEWAIASRMSRARQFNVTESQTGRGATVTCLGLDATAPVADRSALKRPVIPAAGQYDLDSYL